MQEMLDTYDINGNFLGIKTRDECHKANPGVYHKIVSILVVNDKNEILVQKRALCKKQYPDKWDMPAGHIDAGESNLSTCVRETYEELGIKTKADDFKHLKEWVNKKQWEIFEIYILKTKQEISHMKIQKEEVQEVKYLKYDQLISLLYSNSFSGHDKEFKDFVACELKKYVC